MWWWPNSEWWGDYQSQVVTFSSSGTKARCRWSYDNVPVLHPSNLKIFTKDEMLRIKCVLCVTPRPPAPAPPLKPDVDKPAGTNNQGTPSGANSSFDNGFHTADYAPPNGPNNTKLPRQPTVRIYCQANDELSVTARNGTVVLAPANPNDHYQHWIKDMSYGDKVKDASGLPAFALVNRVTGEAIKNPAGENQEISLVTYNKNRLDDSVKWTEMWSTGFRAIRIADTTSLTLTAIASADDDKFSDGTKIVVKKWVGNPLQRWMIVPIVFLGF
ncbi:hypothetical protein FCM35_KLT09496 [Carex littledalei]|uniref:Ricin B lectin domain-containing protein n=1 Tax=Carex littledalei TaxID=544730 RepID=A0A833RGQ9_9POAL|nr:hypothetical protein FCM35_KLT09496 [Carex littledalei]